MSEPPNFQPSEHARRPGLPSAFDRDCAFVSVNLEAHALGALPDDEASRVERHVSTCPRCARSLEQTLGIAAFLPFLSEPVAVPESALAGLLARIDRDHSVPATTAPMPNLNPWTVDESARSWTIPSSRDAYAESMATAPNLAAAARKRRVNWDVWAAPLAAMPLVLALAIVGGWAMNTRSNLQDQKSALQAAKKENQDLTAQLLTFPPATSTAAANSIGFDLTSVNSSGARGALTQLSNNLGVSVKVWNLPVGVKICEIELEAMNGSRVNAGKITIDSSGSGDGNYSLAQPLSAYRYVHVIPVSADAVSANSTAVSTDLLMAQINANLGDTGGTEANSSSR